MSQRRKVSHGHLPCIFCRNNWHVGLIGQLRGRLWSREMLRGRWNSSHLQMIHTMRWMREGYAKINDKGSLVTKEIHLVLCHTIGKNEKGRIKGRRESWSSRQFKYFVLSPLKMIWDQFNSYPATSHQCNSRIPRFISWNTAFSIRMKAVSVPLQNIQCILSRLCFVTRKISQFANTKQDTRLLAGRYGEEQSISTRNRSI